MVYYRKPRDLLIVSGPPFDPARDRDMAALLAQHAGRTIHVRRHHAKLIACELRRAVTFDLDAHRNARAP